MITFELLFICITSIMVIVAGVYLIHLMNETGVLDEMIEKILNKFYK